MTQQQFNTVDQFRLEVEDPTLATGLVNLSPNPDGRLGGYGWITPVANTAIESEYLDWDPWDPGLPGPGEPPKQAQGWVIWIKLRANVLSVFSVYSEPVAVTPGQYFAASASILKVDQIDYTARVRWYNADLTDLGTSAWGPTYHYGDLPYTDPDHDYKARNLRVRTPVTQVPAGANFAALEIRYQAPSGFGQLQFDIMLPNATLATAPTAAPLANLGYVTATAPWRNIAGDVVTCNTSRTKLQLGTLEATLKGLTYDPALSTALVAGRRIRATAPVAGTTDWHPLWSGRILDAVVDYDPLDATGRVTVTAADATAELANAPRPNGVATVPELRAVLEACGVPWICDNLTGQVMSAPAVTYSDGASALDQIAITCDSARGGAWVDRYGTLVAKSRAKLATAPTATLTEAHYLAESFTPRLNPSGDVINEVQAIVRAVLPGSPDTVEVTYSYRNAASVARWGRRQGKFTLQGFGGTMSSIKAKADAFGAAVLASNHTPTRRVESLQLPVRTLDAFAATLSTDGTRCTPSSPHSVFRELGDVIRVTNADAAMDLALTVTGINHTITGDTWTMTHTYSVPAGTAAPTAVPPLQPTRIYADRSAGTVTLTATNLGSGANVSKAVTFPVPFASPPAVSATCTGYPSGAGGMVARISGLTATGCTVVAVNLGNAAATFSGLPVSYIAVAQT